MASHIAIVRAPYDRLILAGKKTIECRLYKVHHPPFGRIAPGERIFIKRSSGPFFAQAIASQVLMADNVTAEQVDQWRNMWDHQICGEAEYWQTKKNTTRFAVFIWLRDVMPLTRKPKFRALNSRAWYVLDDQPPMLDEQRGDPWYSVELTRSNLRYGHVRLKQDEDGWLPADAWGGQKQSQPGNPVELLLYPGPTVVTTDLYRGNRLFRFRGWKPWFERWGARPGDTLRFIRKARRRFAIEHVPG